MSRQTISRKDLGKIYTEGKINKCIKWNKKVEEALRENKWNDTIYVDDSVILEALSEANDDQKKLIHKYFNVPKSIVERAQTLDAVWKETGKCPVDIVPYEPSKCLSKEELHVNAGVVISFVSKFLNESWTPKFDGTQYNYYPWLKFDTSLGRWVWSFCFSDCCVSGSSGAVAYYKSEEIAKHAFKLLEDYYNEYFNTY